MEHFFLEPSTGFRSLITGSSVAHKGRTKAVFGLFIDVWKRLSVTRLLLFADPTRSLMITVWLIHVVRKKCARGALIVLVIMPTQFVIKMKVGSSSIGLL